MTDAEIEQLREEMTEQRSDIREYLDEQGVDVSGWETDDDEADPDAEREPADSG